MKVPEVYTNLYNNELHSTFMQQKTNGVIRVMIQNTKKESDVFELNKQAYQTMLAGAILGSIGLFIAGIFSIRFTEMNLLDFGNQKTIIEIATVSVTIFAELFLSGVVLNKLLINREDK